MFTTIKSASLAGIKALPVEVEVDVSRGLPNFVVVGLADNAIKESKERIRSAIKNCGFKFPARRITVNLAPADLRKEGTALDLPAALGIITGDHKELQKTSIFNDYLFCGELSLNGRVKEIRGALPIALAARESGCKGIFLPRANAAEAAAITEIEIIAVENLLETLDIILEKCPRPSRPETFSQSKKKTDDQLDFADVRGQSQAKRALEIAAAGNHNLLFVGPPGSGKTMLARRLPSILPTLTFEEALETTIIHSVAGLIGSGQGLIKNRPFRQPHHTISDVALIGGGSQPRPGEVTMAHNGVLFLDEFPEFRRSALEVLRQPLESRQITIARAQAQAVFPADFILITAMNPCPCGHYGDPFHECTCSASQIQRYRHKISGPLLDRIDLHIEVPAVPTTELINPNQAQTGDSSKKIRNRVIKAQKIQRQRLKNHSRRNNAALSDRDLKKFCHLDQECRNLLQTAMDRLGLSARAYSRILKVARTIADLQTRPEINSADIAEAIQFRSLDRRITF
ncbi:MAG: YifB family Mg chelatase-like AAA ATPase [Pseudomonadota bacterium]|nr:YifB family Mg chelatase-like AAA ATPase [Pseudomonadota bacterium]